MTRCFLTIDLKRDLLVIHLMWLGSLFQHVAPVYEKDDWPKDFTLGTRRERGPERVLWRVMLILNEFYKYCGAWPCMILCMWFSFSCCTLKSTGNIFTCSNSGVPIWERGGRFRRNRTILFWVVCRRFCDFLVRPEYQEVHA